MKLLDIFWTFFKIGIQAFGGGYTIIVIAQESLVKKKRWLTEKQLIDYLTMSSSLPGIIAINFSAFTGFYLTGVLGAISAVLGVITAPILVVLGIAGLIDRFQDYPVLNSALAGIQLTVCALLLSFTLTMIKTSVRTMASKLLAAVTFCAFCFFPISPAWGILTAGIIGWLYWKYNKKVFN